jgi:archaellum component FlaF (FlaF/FlaG flagellin family)
MGFSVTIASSIVLIGLLAIFSSFSIAAFQGLRDLTCIAKEYVSSARERLDVELYLKIETVNATSCNVTLRNLGCKAIFLRDQNGFKWNTILCSYGNSSQWQSYMIETYEALEVKVTGTNHTFNPQIHSFINPGEEALITFNLPNDAPEIPSQSVVCVTFASHYGVTANAEATREQ